MWLEWYDIGYGVTFFTISFHTLLSDVYFFHRTRVQHYRTLNLITYIIRLYLGYSIGGWSRETEATPGRLGGQVEEKA